MWPFKHSPLLDPDVARWHVDNACWFFRSLRGRPPVTDTRLVLPGREYFPFDKPSEEDLPNLVFEQMKRLAGMQDWPLTVDFNDDGGKEFINVPFGMEPFRLIAMLAHELAVRLIKSIPEPPPCDTDLYDGLADQVATFLGFGIFTANVAEIRTFMAAGKSVGTYTPELNGFLGERERLFDLALFLTVKKLPPGNTKNYLKPSLVDYFNTALIDARAYSTELAIAADVFAT